MANNILFGNYDTIGNIHLCFKLNDAIIIFPFDYYKRYNRETHILLPDQIHSMYFTSSWHL